MEKRKHDSDDWPQEKRLRGDVDEAEFYMEQRLVGWVIGSRGTTLKEIEQAYSVKVIVDQDTKELGYSKVKITGPLEQWQAAAEHINQSLARAAAHSDGSPSIGPFLLDSPPSSCPSDSMTDEVRIEQRYVGWLLGRGGAVVREIEQTSGCKINIKQDTRSQGYSRAECRGTDTERQQAKQLIEDSIDRARGSTGDQSQAQSRAVEDELQIDQKWVGWLLGKGGGVAKEIEEAHDVQIKVDQSTKSSGYSTIKIHGDPANVEMAKERIQGQLQKVGGGCTVASTHGTDQVRVEQKWVGWLLGKSGQVMKEIEQQSGARVTVDQSRKDLGYSMVCMTGSWDCVGRAKHLVMDKINQVNPLGLTNRATQVAMMQLPHHRGTSRRHQRAVAGMSHGQRRLVAWHIASRSPDGPPLH